MSAKFIASLQSKPATNHDIDAHVAIAGIWFALYLVMIVGALIANPSKASLAIFVAVFAAWFVFGRLRKKKAKPIDGGGLIGWREKKKAAA